MIGGHYGEIYKICKNFSPEEKQLVAMTLPTQVLEAELDRRGNIYNNTYDKILEILNNSSMETLDQAEATIKALRKVFKSEGKE